MAFIFAMEITEWDLLSSVTIVSSTSVVSLFAVVSLIMVVSLFAILSLASPSLWCRESHGSSSETVLTAFWCFDWSACHGFECDLSLFLAFFCSFISSILHLFSRSDLQYSCIISKSLLTIFDLRLSRYSLHGPRFIPRTVASMILCSATFDPLAQSLMMHSRYCCRVMLPCFRL